MKLLLSRHPFCVHHTAMLRFTVSLYSEPHSYRLHVCLAVTCQLHLRQNDWVLLHATARTYGWSRYQNKSQHRKLTLEKKILLLFLQEISCIHPSVPYILLLLCTTTKSEFGHVWLRTTLVYLLKFLYVNSCVVGRRIARNLYFNFISCPLYVFIHFSAAFCTVHCALDLAKDHAP